MSPGLPSSGNTQMLPPPLSLPDSFLEDQSDYAGYYSSDVGILSSPQVLSSPQLLSDPQQLHSPMNSGNLYSRQHNQGYPHSPDIPPRQGSRSGGAGIALPSPHMTPTTSPLQNDFPNLSLNGKQTEKCEKERPPPLLQGGGGKERHTEKER
jgi:hypothetical protein